MNWSRSWRGMPVPLMRTRRFLRKLNPPSRFSKYFGMPAPYLEALGTLSRHWSRGLLRSPTIRKLGSYATGQENWSVPRNYFKRTRGTTLIYWQAEASEEHAKASGRLGDILFKLNLVAGFFLPLVALGGLFGMNLDLPDFVKGMFWWVFFRRSDRRRAAALVYFQGCLEKRRLKP